jgi:LmbE family N-acetylglucosaminyl deacetylase
MKLPATPAVFLAALCLTSLLSASASAQTFPDPANLQGERPSPIDGPYGFKALPIDQGPTGLQQLLRRLNTRASLMNIVAHPDDQDYGMLTLVSRGLGARVADLSLNRGEGGQNAMTGDFEDALGLLRTEEILACDRYSGVDQFFGTEVDFGFSKTKQEAFAKWTHDRVLYDVVRAIRLYRPLVLTSTWIGGVTDGHGQHQASGQIAQEAFNAAGDPKVFPELTAEGILPWQPLKIYARVPMQSISDKGLYDYATGQYTPAKFTNYVTGEVTTTPPSTDVVVHEGNTDPILGPATAQKFFKSYVQFARIGLGLQKSQIPAGFREAPAGAFDVAYHRYGSRLCAPETSSNSRFRSMGYINKYCHSERSEGPASSSAAAQSPQEDSFFDGIDTSLAGIATLTPNPPAFLTGGLSKIQSDIATAIEHLNPNSLENIAPALADALQQCTSLIGLVEESDALKTDRESILHELRVKRAQVNQALILALGITFDATATGANQVAGTTISVWASLKSTYPQSITVERVYLTDSTGDISEHSDIHPRDPRESKVAPELTADHPIAQPLTAHDHYTSIITRPYFFRDNIEQPIYQLRIPALRNAPESPAALTAWAQLNFRGVKIEVGHVVHDGPQPVSFVPAASLMLSAHAQIIATEEHSVLVRTFLYPASKPAIAPKLSIPAGWKSTVALGDTDGPGEITLQIDAPASRRVPIVAKASALLPNHEAITEGYRPIGYGDLPRVNYFTPATDRIVPADLKLPAKYRIAYLPGTGDAITGALTSLNLKPDTLTVADLTPAKLAQYDTVILGVRTYSAHPDLHGAPTRALLDYARNGGNVVVQFQTAEFTADDAPYPITLGRDAEKVVDETAPVALLDPASPLLTTPNKITPADFNNWNEERGHGFLRTWDDRYTPLLEVHDPGAPAENVLPQEPQRGGLITTQLGKGRWTYCAFALYRQLPEANPGAYRLFLNFLNP